MMTGGPPDAPPRRSRLGGETVRALASVLGFGAALGATSVLFPLLAVEVGYGISAVALFTSLSAGVQLAVRFALPALLRVVPDRGIIAISAVLLAASAASLTVSVSLAAFVVAQSLQGAARALFWTASQTHAVRSSGGSVRRLAEVQLASRIGNLIGPSGAGLLAAASFDLALWTTVGFSVGVVGVAMTMVRRPPYTDGPRLFGEGLWRRPGVLLGTWTSSLAGGWRGMMDSVVPAVLAGGGLGTAAIGLVASSAEGASIAANVSMVRWRRGPSSTVLRVATIAVMGAVVALPLVAGNTTLAVVVVVVAGAGYGFAATLGPAITDAHATASEQGTVLAMAGAYRAGSRMVTPAVVAAVAPALGLPIALLLVSGALGGPVLSLVRRVSDGATVTDAPAPEPSP